MPKNANQSQVRAVNANDFSILSVLFANTFLKRQSDDSHTRLPLGASADIMRSAGVAVQHVHMLDYTIPPGVQSDVTEHGWDRDDCPELWAKVKVGTSWL
ncbi:hypothetical protein [Peteryoungia algae]|uniref:hypothetical protein n=1 Tax=Peteryoungia algae TaxID=2919917 RepID=UPI0025A06209|nr:hypothetical protein [Rhizobium sp. SSM4.3]